MNASTRKPTMRHDRIAFASLLGALLGAAVLPACDSARPVGGSPPTAACVGCHGGVDNDSGAPPRALDGTNTARSVGAHTAHLGTDVQCGDCHKVPAAVGDVGHRTRLDGTPDGDGRAEITFGPRARQNGSTPTYDPASFTCSGVYCHKTFQGGQGPANPIWDGALAGGECQGCHGAPPANHSQTLTLTGCASCHGTTVTAAGGIKAGGTHLDGTVNAPNGCTACHGDPNRGASDLNKAAPPVDTRGNQASNQVGAHQAHLVAGNLRPAMPCAECHAVPTSTAHSSGATEVPFATVPGTIARNDGATPSFNPTTGTCSGVYCHGATLHGGSNKTPVFSGGGAEVGLGGATVVATCGVCHGFPPTSDATFTHPQEASPGVPFSTKAQCNACHPQTINPDGSFQLANHVNGVVDGGGHAAGFRDPAAQNFHGPVALAGLDACRTCHGATFANDMGGGLSCNACHADPAAFGLAGYGTHANWQTECTFCHGDPNRAEDTSFPLVGEAGVNQMRANKAGPPVVTGRHLVGPGAHQAHYDAATNQYSAALICTNCHGSPLPSNLDHVVGSVVANWGPLAQTDGVVPFPAQFTPAWEGNPNCTNYCHGATLAGGTKTNPNWLEGATGTSCGSCHAIPLPYTAAGGFHVQNPDCGKCHTGYSSTSVIKSTHVDGQKTVIALVCTSCHGTAGRVGIAGADSDVAAAPPGSTAGLAAGVRVGAHQAHVNANTLRASPLVCVDCHGTKPASIPHANGVVANGFSALAQTGTTATPTAFDAAWEAAPTCANYCHGATLAGGNNTTPTWTGANQAQCGACHGIPLPYTAAGGFHVQNTACGNCHTGYTSASVAGAKATHINGAANVVALGCTTCHGLSAPFSATDGSTAASNVRVGAHNKHLQTTITTAVACADCHSFPSQPKHANGAVNITWSSRATAGGATVTPPNGTIPTAQAVSCANYCHGVTLPGGAARTAGWTGGALGCTGCHGAPPDSANNAHQVGDHPTTACNVCHYAVMTAGNTTISNPALHINGARNVQLNPGQSGTITANGGGSYSCNVSGCHGTNTTGGW